MMSVSHVLRKKKRVFERGRLRCAGQEDSVRIMRPVNCAGDPRKEAEVEVPVPASPYMWPWLVRHQDASVRCNKAVG
jgi:hypothetical protein